MGLGLYNFSIPCLGDSSSDLIRSDSATSRNEQSLANEKGVALAELAILLPIIMGLFILIFDVGMAVDRHLSLTRVSYETARYAATLPGLERHASSCSDPTIPIFHKQVCMRTVALLATNKFPLSSISSIKIGYADTATANDIVQISVSINHDAPLSRGIIPIRSSTQAPHLYPASGA